MLFNFHFQSSCLKSSVDEQNFRGISNSKVISCWKTKIHYRKMNFRNITMGHQQLQATKAWISHFHVFYLASAHEEYISTRLRLLKSLFLNLKYVPKAQGKNQRTNSRKKGPKLDTARVLCPSKSFKTLSFQTDQSNFNFSKRKWSGNELNINFCKLRRNPFKSSATTATPFPFDFSFLMPCEVDENLERIRKLLLVANHFLLCENLTQIMLL